ncbi:MAG: hypothetical protein GY854_20460 [Deltaproteobacteria bacterium]|nr:hypothetical protein [Deltaproteobacteria bacterium]
MFIAAIIFVVLASLMALINISGPISARMDQKKGIDRGYTYSPVISLAFSSLAWFTGGDELGPYVFIPAIVDPGTWLLVIAPFVLIPQFLGRDKSSDNRQ